jgi:glutamyl-tRNA reductase
MQLTYNDESFSEWSEKVIEFEMERAMRLISKGKNEVEVLEEYSKRITEKLLHPLYPALFKPVGYDVEESKRKYADAYLSKRSPVADHVSD